MNENNLERCLECGYLLKNCECNKETLNNCKCCKGICDCEYGCEHPHNTDFEEFEKSSEFNLSNKRMDVELFTPSGFNEKLKAVYNEKDVQEFIKLLKEKSNYLMEFETFNKIIDKLAGDKLN